MNSLNAWYDPTTWFQDEVPDVTGTGGSFTTNPNNDPFGWSTFLGGGTSTDIQAGVSDSQLSDWNTYWSSGGVLGANLTGNTSNPGTSSTDIFSGFSDFFSGLTNVLPGLAQTAQTGLGIWANVQSLINAQNPSDELVQLPGSNTPVIKRTTGGQAQYYPITQLYPSLAPQVQSAQNSWIGPLLITGVLGLGLIFILKKKD